MKAVGIILAGGNSSRMRELTHKRAVAAMPVAGSYRSIDFALSNMSNSHIQKVAVLTQYNARSLNEHLNSSKWWDFGRKQGGLYVFTPTITMENGYWYRGTADAIYQNLDFLKKSHEPYVIITSGDAVYKLDYNKVLEYHIAKKADITVVCKEMDEDADVSRYGTVKMNDSCRIEEFEEKPVLSRSNIISTGIYVIRRRQLIDLIERCAEEGRFDFVQDILIRYKNVKKIYGYKISNYWSNIATVNDYYRTNMDFLKRLKSSVCHPRNFRCKPFHMILFFLQKTLRNKHRKVYILYTCLLKSAIQFMLDILPDCISCRFDHHTPFYTCVIDQLRFLYHIRVPLCKIIFHGSDRFYEFFVFRHTFLLLFFAPCKAHPTNRLRSFFVHGSLLFYIFDRE